MTHHFKCRRQLLGQNLFFFFHINGTCLPQKISIHPVHRLKIIRNNFACHYRWNSLLLVIFAIAELQGKYSNCFPFSFSAVLPYSSSDKTICWRYDQTWFHCCISRYLFTRANGLMDLEIFSGTCVFKEKSFSFLFQLNESYRCHFFFKEKFVVRLGEEPGIRESEVFFPLVLFSCFARQHVSLIVIRRSDSKRDWKNWLLCRCW